MNSQELFYQLALNQVQGIGPVRFRKILESNISAQEIFESQGRVLKQIEGTPATLVNAVASFNDFNLIEKEMEHCDQEAISIINFQNKDYPTRLLHCQDAPPILFFKGNANLNANKIISIVGTRANSDYGRKLTEDLIEQFKIYQPTICSGLAFGIDIIAHKVCLKHQLPTVGVMASGFKKIYPSEHRNTANEMMEQGGLLTEYYYKTEPNRENFPTRNRIVAGMSDATLVIETDLKGGSMITAELAHGYNRDVFCVPGRANDAKSAGCNFLIKSLKGQLVTQVEDIAKALNWDNLPKVKKQQRQLFVNLNEHEQIIYNILKENESMHIDELVQKSQLNTSQVAGAMLNMEMQALVNIKPGKLVSIVD